MTDLKLSLSFVREMKKDYRAYISDLINQHGPAFAFKGPKFNLHIIADPKYFQHILGDHSNKYIFPLSDIVQKFIGKHETIKEKVAGEEEWTKERVNTIESLIGPSAIKAKTQTLIDNSTRILDSWQPKVGTQIAVRQEMMAISTRNLCDIFFGGIKDLEPSSLLHTMQEFFYLLGQYEMSITKLAWRLPTQTYFRTKRLIENLRKTCNHIAQDCLSPEKSNNNVIRELAKLYLPSYPNLNTGDKNILMQRVAALLIGGSENVPTFLTHALDFLSRHHYAADKVYKEVDAVLGNRPMQPADIEQLKYVRAFISESLRLSTGPFLARSAAEDDEIAGYKIKKLDRILIPIFHIHRNPEHWENPEAFNPERFMQPLPAGFSYYIPFGYGPRDCLGGAFAMTGMMTLLPAILQRYRLDAVPNIKVDPDFQRQEPGSRLLMMNLKAKNLSPF